MMAGEPSGPGEGLSRGDVLAVEATSGMDDVVKGAVSYMLSRLYRALQAHTFLPRKA